MFRACGFGLDGLGEGGVSLCVLKSLYIVNRH